MTPPPRKTNLAPERSSFVGRTREVAELRRLLRGSRLVSIVGPPGVGKTRLAMHVARERVRDLGAPGSGGVWFVDLRAARRTDDVRAALATALDLHAPLRSTADADAVSRTLAERGRVLIVLDNMDRLAAQAAVAVNRWLTDAPEATFLLTSRQALSVEGEQRYELGPLTTKRRGARPDARSEAAELFVARARGLRPSYAPDAAASAVIDQIVQRLEGLPLAIELAASRTSMLGEPELLDMLPRVLEGAHPREGGRTLRAAIASSWELLGAQERHALMACSVFAGGFSLEAAAQVLAPRGGISRVLELLHLLSERSLVFARRTTGPRPAARYGMYESIKDFARQKLRASGRGSVIEGRHAAFFVTSGRSWAAAFLREGDLEALRALLRERDNLSLVAERALAAPPEGRRAAEALGALVALDPVCASVGPLESHIALLDRALALPARGTSAVLRCQALLARGKSRAIASVPGAERDLETALRLSRRAGVSELIGACTMELGTACARRGALVDASRRYEEARALFRRAGARRLVARTLGQLGLVLYRRGELDAALAHFQAQEAALADVRDPALATVFHTRIGAVHHERGDLRQARVHYRRGLALARRARSRRDEAIAHAALGLLAWEMGDLEKARTAHTFAIALTRAIGDPAYEAICLASAGAIEADAGRKARATRLMTEARRLAREEGDPRLLAALELYEAIVDVTRARRPSRKADAAIARELRERARARLARADQSTSEDIRFARRMLRAQLDGPKVALAAGAESGHAALAVDAHGAWFRAPGTTTVVSLVERPTLGRLLLALVARRREAKDGGATTFELIDAGWPGQSVSPLAGANRVYVALSLLRKLGLKHVLVRTVDGYALDPAVPLRLARSARAGCDS